MPSYFPPASVSQIILDARTRQNEVTIKSEADLALNSTLVSGVRVLNPTDYYFDGSTVELSTPIAPPDIGGSGTGAARIFANGIIKYTGTGAFIRNNPNGTLPNAIGFFNLYLQGDGVNSLFDLSDTLQGVAIVSAVFDNFNGSILKRNTLVLFSQVRLLNSVDTFVFIDNNQIRISQSIDTSGTLGGKPYYEIKGTTSIVNIGGDPQAIFQNPNDTYLKIDPFLNFKTMNINGVGLDNAAGGASTGRLFTAGLSGTGTASNNGSGEVRINSPLHGLSDLESIWVQGFNPYRTKGYKIELIDANNFDLLGDQGGILSFTDAGGGLIDVTTDLKHRLVNGDSVVITSGTYSGTYTVSGVTALTTNVFQITEVFAGTDTGTYKHYEPFTTAGDNLNWYSGSLSETTPGISSLNNGQETDSTVEIVVEYTDAGPTALNATTWVSIAVAGVLQNDGEQRFEIANDGKIYYVGKRQVIVIINTSLRGQLSTGTETDILFSYLINAETMPRTSTNIDGTTWKNVDRGKNVISILTLTEGDYINPPAAKLLAGTTNITIQPSRCFVKK